jgi:hypothetical protein
MPRRRDDLHVFHARLLECIGDKPGGALHIRFVLRKRADAGNPQKSHQFIEQPLLILLDE